jgi:signal transduction histidine kinase
MSLQRRDGCPIRMPVDRPETPTAPPADRDALAATYADERAATVRYRLVLTVALYLAFMVTSVPVEWRYHPERLARVTLVYAGEALSCLLALAACRWAPLQRHAVPVAALLGVALGALMSAYNAAVAGPAERLAMAHVCLLSGLVVLLPWGWRAQLAVAVGSLASLAAAAPWLVAPDTLSYTFLAGATGGTTTVFGAFFLDRYRYEAFVRTALQTEEAAIAAALLRVAETLDAHLDRPEMLSLVNRLAAELLGCDFISTWVWDERRDAYVLGGEANLPPATRAEVEQLEFGRDSLPLFARLRQGETVEVADRDAQTLIPAPLLRRFDMASVLSVPLLRRGDMTGILCAGYWTRTGSFSPTQRRLARGIAHATAVALRNARLIGDLQEANRLKSDFVSTMSHELRTPLNVITGYADLMADGAFGPLAGEQHDGIARIRRSAVELLDLVSATLDLGRLEAGREALRIGPVSVGGMLGELGRELGPLVPISVDLRWHDETGAAPIETDGVKLKTILKNLVGNAIKFTPAGSVAVRVARVDDTLVCEVRDTGIGIGAADLPHIFDMFRQVDGSSTRHFGGVGLGLYIVKRLTDALGGTLDVASTPGAGSTFTVRIPITAETPLARATAS